ncbi:MAG TPA: ATP phosphoribosyltransferase regulatory subunit, partial [Sphingorhabdus sp.]|nr:ATP phosphoribosyltransferase regulatory subunit [Sphingorhabdus sp.]
EPQADVELLVMADQLLKELGINEGVTLQLNTLGDAASRDAWRTALVEHFRAHANDLSEDSRDRLERNPLRILDSKDPRDRPAADTAPRMVLSAEAEDFYGAVKAGLDAANVAYNENPFLVRGLDYYRHTAFEFVTDRLGAQGTVLGGGRYDGLIENLGGPATPAVGWAAGIERLAMLVDMPIGSQLEVVVVAEGEGLDLTAYAAVNALRRSGIAADVMVSGAMKKRFDKAVKLNPKQIFSLRPGGYGQQGRGAEKAELDRVRDVILPVIDAVQ